MTEEEKAAKCAEEIQAVLKKHNFAIHINATNELVPVKSDLLP